MKKVLLTDVDGVLVDWVGSFGRYAESQGHKLRMKTPETWEMTEWLGVEGSTIQKLIKEFNSSKAFAEIPVFKDALSALPEISRYYDLVAITCCSSDPETVANRKKNLEMLNVKFKEIHCLNATESKSRLLNAYAPTIWVEDRIEGAEAGHSAGHRAFLRDTTYNNNFSHPDIGRITSWNDILKLIKKEESRSLSSLISA